MAFASSRIGAQEAILKPCDLCEEDENVNWFCKDCDQNLCERCKRTHLRSNVSKSHIVLSISEGFAMGKRNISNICQDHDEPFLFLCRHCEKNICPTCLSTEHKRHDFVDVRKLQSEMQKELNVVIKEKEDEIQEMAKDYDDLVLHEKEMEGYLENQYAHIDKKVKAIKFAADEGGKKMKESICVAKERHDKEIKESQHELQTQLRIHKNEIQIVQQDLRLQAASSLHDFVLQSKSKLQSLQALSVAKPNTGRLFSDGIVDQNQILQMIGKVETTTNVLDTENVEKVKQHDEIKYNVLSELKIISAFNLNQTEKCLCMSLSPDGSIWLGGIECVYKVSSYCSTVIQKMLTRHSFACCYIACLHSGDAVVSYGGPNFLDRVTSNGSIVEFTHFQEFTSAHDIAVTKHDEVVINKDSEVLAFFSNRGKLLKEIKFEGGIETFCLDGNGNIIIQHTNSSNISELDVYRETIKCTWSVPTSDINNFTCDKFGNILASNLKNNIYFFSKTGDVTKTFTMDCNNVIGICVNQDDHLMILSKVNVETKMLLAKYVEYI